MRVLDAVEGGGLDHGVVGHVFEGQSVTDFQWLLEGPVADDVACQVCLGQRSVAGETVLGRVGGVVPSGVSQ